MAKLITYDQAEKLRGEVRELIKGIFKLLETVDNQTVQGWIENKPKSRPKTREEKKEEKLQERGVVRY